MMRKKYYTVKEWNRLGLIRQGYETKNFEVILKDYDVKKAERRQKIKNTLRKFNQKNLDAALKKFDKTLDSVSKGIDEFGKMSREFNMGVGKRDYGSLIGKDKKRDYSFLIGKK